MIRYQSMFELGKEADWQIVQDLVDMQPSQVPLKMYKEVGFYS
jgi:hypothetical protein